MITKETYLEEMESQLGEWHTDIEKLRNRVDITRARLKLEYYHQLEGFLTKQAVVQEKLQQLK
jgi:hypothetical protein